MYASYTFFERFLYAFYTFYIRFLYVFCTFNIRLLFTDLEIKESPLGTDLVTIHTNRDLLENQPCIYYLGGFAENYPEDRYINTITYKFIS